MTCIAIIQCRCFKLCTNIPSYFKDNLWHEVTEILQKLYDWARLLKAYKTFLTLEIGIVCKTVALRREGGEGGTNLIEF